jgi:mannan endo-1,4-beta-mannosidase
MSIEKWIVLVGLLAAGVAGCGAEASSGDGATNLARTDQCPGTADCEPEAGSGAEPSDPSAAGNPWNAGDGIPADGVADGGDEGEGTATRPSYNTGTGFFVANGKLYDANGIEFIIRGVNKVHYDSESPGIPKTGSNTARWAIYFTEPAANNVALLQSASIDENVIAMPANWDGTCLQDTATLTAIVDTWVAQVADWETLERHMILNIANEWGPSDSTVWRDAYITAIGRLRTAGYTATIAVDSGGCGQDRDDLVKYAQAVFDSDPQKNVIFDLHIYGNWFDGDGPEWAFDLTEGLDAIAALGLPVFIGEFGPGRNIGPSPTMITPRTIMQNAESRNFGWLAWAWDDPSQWSTVDDNWFALSYTGDYQSSADLTIFGKVVVEDEDYGLRQLAVPATIF